MKIKVLAALFLMAAFWGCASLNHFSYFENSVGKGSFWRDTCVYYSYQAMDFTTHWNSFDNENFTINMSPPLLPGVILALGFSYTPVIVPVSLYPFRKFKPSNDSLRFEMVINPKGRCSVDISRISFLINDTLIKPSQVYCNRITSDSIGIERIARFPNTTGSERITLYTYKEGETRLDTESLYVSFQLPVLRDTVEKVCIKFNSFSSVADSVQIHDLQIKKKRRLVYVPDFLARAMNH